MDRCTRFPSWMTAVKPERNANQKKEFDHKPHEQKFNSNPNCVPHGVLLLFPGYASIICPGTSTASVRVHVEHEVRLKNFTEWLDQPDRSPRDVIQRQKIRSILGMPAAR